MPRPCNEDGRHSTGLTRPAPVAAGRVDAERCPHRPARARYLLAGAFSAGGVAAGGVVAGGVAGVVLPASPVAGPVVLRSVTEGVVVFVVVVAVVSGPLALRAHNPMSTRITSARMKNRV